jgi:transcriptional regulator with XRE-family HTH domain
MVGMTHDVLKNYEQRAFAARVSMTDLCKRAGVAGSTITRWRKGKKPWAQTLFKLDQAIAQIERERNA